MNGFTFFEGDPGVFSDLRFSFERQPGRIVSGSLFLPAAFISYLSKINGVPLSAQKLKAKFTAGNEAIVVHGFQSQPGGGSVEIQDVPYSCAENLVIDVEPYPDTGIWCSWDPGLKVTSASVFVRGCFALKSQQLYIGTKRIKLKNCLWQGSIKGGRNSVASFRSGKKTFKATCRAKRRWYWLLPSLSTSASIFSRLVSYPVCSRCLLVQIFKGDGERSAGIVDAMRLFQAWHYYQIVSTGCLKYPEGQPLPEVSCPDPLFPYLVSRAFML